MNKFILILLSLLYISFEGQEAVNDEAGGDQGKKNDKSVLLNYLNETAEDLEMKVSGLSEEQLKFKPSEESWSISQCLEHIVATEKMMLQSAMEVLKKPENPERREEVKVTDEQLMTGIVDRQKKFKAPAELEPTGTYNSPGQALEDFKRQREEMKEYINSLPGNLRNHITDSPAGPIDAHQSLLFIAGHTARHTAQIEEIKTQPGFPQ